MIILIWPGTQRWNNRVYSSRRTFSWSDGRAEIAGIWLTAARHRFRPWMVRMARARAFMRRRATPILPSSKWNHRHVGCSESRTECGLPSRARTARSSPCPARPGWRTIRQSGQILSCDAAMRHNLRRIASTGLRSRLITQRMLPGSSTLAKSPHRRIRNNQIDVEVRLSSL